MSDNIARRGFLAVLTLITFNIPLLLADEVSLFVNWLYIFVSWSLILLLAALLPAEEKDTTVPHTDVAPKE